MTVVVGGGRGGGRVGATGREVAVATTMTLESEHSVHAFRTEEEEGDHRIDQFGSGLFGSHASR